MTLTLSQRELPYKHWEYINSDSGDSIRIVPERGGLITSWICNGREILYLDQVRFKNPLKSVRGGIPVLFPICGDLPNNKFIIDKKEYSLKQHGFARDASWQLHVIEDQSGVLMRLNETQSTLNSYPFEFTLEMEIRLKINSLEILAKIINNSNKLMPFSFGLHPYFYIKDLNHVRIDGLTKECINQKKMKKSETSFELKQLSNGIDLIAGPTNSTVLLDLIDQVSLEMKSEEPFDLSVVWTDPPRQMVCLEPWTSPRNSLINGDRTIVLRPGEMQALKCHFIFNQLA